MTDNIGITANIDEICVSIPSWYNVNMEMLGQARSGGPAEIHSDIESVWFNCEGESFLRFSYEFCYLQKFLVISLVKRGYVTGWSN